MITRHDMKANYNPVKLMENLSVPSLVHGYSVAIEYMKHWFLKEFQDDYFKSIYIEGKYLFDDMINFNKEKLVVKNKPMLAIVPSVNPEYNRDGLDLQLSGRDVLLRRALYRDYSFLRDYEMNQFLGLRLRELEMNFAFKIRVGSRAQQLDLLEYMKLAFRNGSTQGTYLDIDFHVPNEIILAMAVNNGFEIIPATLNNDLYRVKDIQEFLGYLNTHSIYPFIYKYRAINGNSEFFIKMHHLYAHISNLESITIDDGERLGFTENNYHLEMNVILHIPVPHYYFYYSNTALKDEYKERNNLAGLYTLSAFDIEPPEMNKKGWPQFLSTEYTNDSNSFTTINFKELLRGGKLIKVMEHSIKTGISPAIFLDIIIYNAHKELIFDIDWENYEIKINRTLPAKDLMITIYIDLEYANNMLMNIEKVFEKNNRIDYDYDDKSYQGHGQ